MSEILFYLSDKNVLHKHKNKNNYNDWARENIFWANDTDSNTIKMSQIMFVYALSQSLFSL